jgi:tetratricopeptide (TPR) repeat protein
VVPHPGSVRRLWVSAVAVASAACGGSSLSKSCQALLADGRHEAAVPVCEQAFASGDDSAGFAAAQAHFALGRDERVREWSERLRGTSEHHRMLVLAARNDIRAGRLDGAKEKYLHAVDASRATGDHGEASRALYGLFWIAWTRSQYREALLRCHEALDESRLANDSVATVRAGEGLFTVLYEIGDLESAAAALAAAEDLRPVTDATARARFLNNRGVILLGKRRYRLARHTFERALVLAEQVRERDLMRGLHVNLVEANVALGDIERARRHIEAGAGYSSADPQRGAAFRYWRGRLDMSAGDHVAARETFEEALRGNFPAEWTWQFEYEAARAAEAIGDLARAESGYGRAAHAIERMRAELGRDELQAWLLDSKRKPLEALFRVQVARPGSQIAALGTLERATARSFVDAFIREAAGPGEEAEGSPSDRAEALRALLPAASVSPAVALRPVGALLGALRDRHVIAYFEADDRLWIATVTGGRATLRAVDEPADSVAGLVERSLANPEDASLAARLGAVLLPDGVLPPPESIVYVVPDGPVARLSFAALRRRNRYLIEDHPIAYAPSLNALAMMQERPLPNAALPPLVVGDPRGDLPHAREEAEAVASRVGGVTLLGSVATVEAIKAARRPALLHLATHSGYGPAGAWLQLADVRLTTETIVSERIAPRLVVLATCASARPRGRSVSDTIAAAFVVAGSEAVVASLWSVEDAATDLFIRRFYEEAGHSAPGLALARSQRSFIREGRPVSSWAPFVVVGVPVLRGHRAERRAS